MIALSSDQWKQLRHAYGFADDIPEYLEAIYIDPSENPETEDRWHWLWSALCHQGDIYDASIASIPHFVKIVSSANILTASGRLFSLPAAIEESRLERHHQVDHELIDSSYIKALEELAIFASETPFRPADRVFNDCLRFARNVLSPYSGLPPQDESFGPLFEGS